MFGIDKHNAYGYNIKVISTKNMKNLSTTTPKHRLLTRHFLVGMAFLMAVMVPVSTMNSTVRADPYDDKINAIASQVSGFQAEAARLAGEAASLKQALDSLTAQKNTIQAQVDLSQAKYDKLIAEIAANEKKLLDQQTVLTTTISDLTSESQVSPIEVLAGSSSIGDYVVRQERLGSIQDQLQGSIKEIVRIKEELAKQKVAVEQVLNDQKTQRDALAAKEAEQAQLVAATQNQEAAYQGLIGQKNSEISSLRAQQAAANAAAAQTYNTTNLTSGGSRCGGYPAVWCNAPQDSLVDNWGMYNRECVSYTAWKVAASGRRMPYWGGRGNANEWPSSAAASGIPTGTVPRVGSVAVMYTGYYGHVMYVERINSNGSIHVSQFNWGVAGEYSEMDISPSGLVFVYF